MKPHPVLVSHIFLFCSAAMADRKAELEKKRKKLEELKKAREQNKLQAKDKEVASYIISH